MKKRILIVLLLVIIAGVCAGFIINTNKRYTGVKTDSIQYGMNETVDCGEYSVTVNSYEILDAKEFIDRYNISEKDSMADETVKADDTVYVVIADVTMDITGDMKGFPYADINLVTGAVCQGISATYHPAINDADAIKNLEKGSKKEIKIPFLIHSISFPYAISVDKLNDMKWDIYFSVTPAKYVRLGE